jgi:hypothetical protein
MMQSRANEVSIELEKKLEFLDVLATAIESSSDVDADMNGKLAELANEIKEFTRKVRDDKNASLNRQNLVIAGAMADAIMNPDEDNRKILRKVAKATYYEAISYKIEALITKTKKALQSQLLRFFIGFIIGFTATATLGPIGGVIAIAAGVYIDKEAAKHTPEQLAGKAASAEKTSTGFSKVHGLLTKVVKTPIDSKTQGEIINKVNSHPKKR